MRSRRSELSKKGGRENSERRREERGVDVWEEEPFFRRAAGFFLDDTRGEE